MTDTKTPSPSDADLFALIKEHLGLDKRMTDTVIDRKTGRFHDAQRYRNFTRAVLDRWGAQPAGEPECICAAKDTPFGTCCKVRTAFEKWYDDQNDGRLQPFDVFKGGWIERHRLSSTPQPAPVREPLALEQIERIYQRYGGDMVNCTRSIERHHGITK